MKGATGFKMMNLNISPQISYTNLVIVMLNSWRENTSNLLTIREARKIEMLLEIVRFQEIKNLPSFRAQLLMRAASMRRTP